MLVLRCYRNNVDILICSIEFFLYNTTIVITLGAASTAVVTARWKWGLFGQNGGSISVFKRPPKDHEQLNGGSGVRNSRTSRIHCLDQFGSLFHNSFCWNSGKSFGHNCHLNIKSLAQLDQLVSFEFVHCRSFGIGDLHLIFFGWNCYT